MFTIIIELRVAYSARNFAKSSFFESGNFKMQGCQWYVVKRIKSTVATKGNIEKSLQHLLIISGGFHFFNKTDLKQYLFKRIRLKAS